MELPESILSNMTIAKPDSGRQAFGSWTSELTSATGANLVSKMWEVEII